MIQVEWQIEPAVTELRAMLARLRDLSPAWRVVLAYLRRATAEQFASQGGRSGSQWQPLTLAYSKQKARRFPGQPILRASDQLYRSLVEQTGDSVAIVEPMSLTYGTRRFYGRFHQRGDRPQPKRQFLAVIERDKAEIKKTVRLHLENQSALSGFERV